MKTPTDTLPAAPAEPQSTSTAVFHAELIPLVHIEPSPTNPRKKFDADAQAEMEASMREHGFTMSTLLVRRHPDSFRIDAVNEAGGQVFVMRKTPAGVESTVDMVATTALAEEILARLPKYELVAGERRYRAAKAVGIEKAPCIIRELSDREVIELQLVENLQRKDLTALETALGFQQLIALRDDEGKTIHTTKTLHDRTGMSVRYIERHLRLCVLALEDGLKDFLKAFEDGVVGFKHALAVARMPSEKMRARLAKEILSPKFEEAPLSVRKMDAMIQSDYMTDLRDAPFDLKDEKLVPMQFEVVKKDANTSTSARVAGGACTDCPFRLGNAKDLFDGPVPSGMANMCLNPLCFESKKAEGWKKWQVAETDPERKRTALGEKESRQVYQYGDQLAWNSEFVDLADKPDSSVLKAGAEASGTWKKLTKDAGLPVTVARDRNGKVHELVKVSEAIQAADLNGHKIFKKQEVEKPKSDAERQREADAHALEREVDERRLGALVTALCTNAEKSKALPVGFYPEAIQILLEDMYGDVPEDIEARHEWKQGTLVATVKKLPEEKQFAVFVELLFGMAANCRSEGPILKLFGIETAKIEKEVAVAVKAEAKKRGEVLEEIRVLADKARLKISDLDGLAEKICKSKFGAVRDVAVLETIREAVKSAPASDEASAKAIGKAVRKEAKVKGKKGGAK